MKPIRGGIYLALIGLVAATACNSEILERQAAQLREQEEEIARQQKELEALAANQQAQDQKQKDCARAFREYFDKAQAASDRNQTIALYRDGLAICPDDDVAHYELGRALADAGRRDEAEREFAAALKINPDFGDARRQLEAIRASR